jgi:hypothetical protein
MTALTGALLAALTLGGAKPAASAPPYRISGPATHENLALFFVHGADQIKGGNILTLDEALQTKTAVVHETKNVNELAVANYSTTESVFIQAGDIVKGGQQDRTIAVDLVVPPRAKDVPLPSYCVEQGRWSQRGIEDATCFARSNDNLVGNSLKLAARKSAAQGEVWSNVARAQRQLGVQLKAEVLSKDSATSLALTLEHKKLLEAVDVYVKKLQPALDKQTDVIGYAVAINGKVNNADVYASSDLFRKLWPKLLRASAVEAIAARKPGAKPVAVRPEAVTAFLAEAEKGKRSERAINRMYKELRLEAAKNVLYETREAGKGPILRRSYLAK